MRKDSKFSLRSGRQIPVMGLGTSGMHHTAEVVRQALTLGYQLIDTSGNYGTQPAIGQGLKASGFERSAYYLTSKIETDEDAYQATIKDLEVFDFELSHQDMERLSSLNEEYSALGFRHLPYITR